MNMQDILKQIDTMLAPGTAPTRQMTSTEFLEHVKAEVAKAEAEPDKGKAKKRLEHLRKVVVTVSKASWEGDNGESIPLFVDPDQLQPTETESSPVADAGKGTAADGVSFAATEGTQSFAKAIDDVIKGLDAAPAPAPVAKAAPAFTWPRDVTDKAFMKEGVAKRGDVWGADNEASK